MKLSKVKIAGFRGIKECIELDIPQGFLVITGRNGSGKSTICDAIEYAITGEIRLHTSHKERGESIQDYVWWRGDGTPEECYVTISFTNADGEEIEISRTPDNVRVSNDIEIQSFLTDQELAPPNCLQQLCKTTIIRDEEITNLSLDITEAQRFEFVQSAIGTFDFTCIENKADKAQNLLKEKDSNIVSQYESIRKDISDITSRLSEAKAEASKESDIKNAITIINSISGDNEEVVAEPLKVAKKAISVLRNQTDNLIVVLNDLKSIFNRLSEIKTDEFKKKIAEIRKLISESEKQLSGVDQEINEYDKVIAVHEKEKPILTSLAQLHEHGLRLGLKNGCCPLCGSKILDQEYEYHLIEVEQQINKASVELSKLIGNRTNAYNKREAIISEIEITRRKLSELTTNEEVIEEELNNLRLKAEKFNFNITQSEDFDTTRLSIHIEKNTKLIRELELAMKTLEASRAYESLLDLEKELDIKKQLYSKIDTQMSKVKHAENKVKESIGIIKRVSGELVDERLAELSPLISELYLRLRPHIIWREINYYIRGDVRHFKGFEVEGGLNPSFMFSSGQRRAAGLAFLLAVHLSRTWCLLQTLILDDPVQHVDDYRALHLSEVLSGIRLLDRQIICTVEDQALANLLCRRLRCTAIGEGNLVDMAYDPKVGVHISKTNMIRPMSSQVLLSA